MFLAHPLIAFPAGCGLLFISFLLLQLHIAEIRQMRAETLPDAARAATLEEHLSLLQKQVEASRLSVETQQGSLKEKLHVYVLPKDASVDRALSFLTATFDAAQTSGDVKDISAITVGDPEHVASSGTLLRRPLSFAVTVRQDKLQHILSAFDLSGLLTVQDALTTQQLQDLFTLTEAENPAGIVALGQFLSADLLQYLREPRPVDEHFIGSFSSNAFASLVQHLATTPFFKEGRAYLAIAGDAWEKGSLWPAPFLSVQSVKAEAAGDGWVRLTLHLASYGRSA
jgi:hypothetical protein